MTRQILALLCGIGLFSAAPNSVWAQKKKGPKEMGARAEPKDYLSIQSSKELVGKMGASDEKSITFGWEITHYEPNPAFKPGKYTWGPTGGGASAGFERRYAEIMRDQAELARIRDPRDRQRRLQQIMNDMQRLQNDMARAMMKGPGKAPTPPKDGPFKAVTETKTFDLPLEEKVVVRWAALPFEYDDKGMVKKYSKEEMDKLRGKDPKLPGFEGKLGDLALGQSVKIFLHPPKVAKKDKEKATLPDDDGLLGIGSVDRPSVYMILILDTTSMPLAPPKKGK